MTYTNKARAKLALIPMLGLALFILIIIAALEAALHAFFGSLVEETRDRARTIYYHVYRPARYGHVRDAA